MSSMLWPFRKVVSLTIISGLAQLTLTLKGRKKYILLRRSNSCVLPGFPDKRREQLSGSWGCMPPLFWHRVGEGGASSFISSHLLLVSQNEKLSHFLSSILIH